MSSGRPSIEISEEQALYFRARRTHLAGPGAPDSVAAARSIVGAQAQQENPALLALALRTADRPTAPAVRAELLEAGSRRLVRTWGQRDTLHIYSLDDWATVIGAIPEWPQSGRRGGMPTDEDLKIVRTAFEEASEPLFRRQLFDLIPRRYLDELADHPGAAGSPERFAATRLIWCLAKEGEICLAQKEGSEQAYAYRQLWFPDLSWLASDGGDEGRATLELTRRYLRAFGPATPADVAHFFGSTVGAAKVWLARLDGELADVACGQRRGLLALAADLPELDTEPPRGVTGWPVRLLPQWDTHTMTHKDKSWVVPRPQELKLVWRKAAVNAPTVVARGRFVATWSHRATKKRVLVVVRPMSGWRSGYRRQVEREARQLASHLGVSEAAVEIGHAAA